MGFCAKLSLFPDLPDIKMSASLLRILVILTTCNLASSEDFIFSPRWNPLNKTHLGLSGTVPGYAMEAIIIGLYDWNKFLGRSPNPERGRELLVNFEIKINPCLAHQSSLMVKIRLQGEGTPKESSRFGYSPSPEVTQKCVNGILEVKQEVQLSATSKVQWWMIYAAVGGGGFLLLLLII